MRNQISEGDYKYLCKIGMTIEVIRDMKCVGINTEKVITDILKKRERIIKIKEILK